MSDINKIKVYKYKNIAAALAVMLLALVALSTSCGAGASAKTADKGKHDTVDSLSAESADDNGSSGKRLTKNYVYKEMHSVNDGLLVQVNSQRPFTGNVGETDQLYQYLFTPDGELLMAAGYPSDEALKEMLEALNRLALDFKAYSGLDTLMVTTLMPEEGTSVKSDEAYIGSCAELMVNEDGDFKKFTGTEDYAWIPNNCYKYGFVMRGANKLRYIGKEAAACIRDMGITDGAGDLETLEITIKDYTFEEPLYFTDEGGKEYAGYFVPVGEGETTSIPVPAKADNSEFVNFISGNNDDGYIVFADLTDVSTDDKAAENGSVKPSAEANG